MCLLQNPSTASSRVRNLRAAKHRFESYQRPLGRTIRLFRPLVLFAARLANERRDHAGKSARDWLDFIAESPIHILQTAMLADAADEGMSLTRFCDLENMDVASLSSRVATFLDRVTNLFGPNRRCLTVFGYTRSLLEELQRRPIVWVFRRRTYSLRQPLAADIDVCVGHMQAWLRLCAAEVSAEFPDWEVAQAFRVFDLPPSGDGDATRDPHFEQHVARLARACDVNDAHLLAQFSDHEHLARQVKHEKRCSNKTAWVEALKRGGRSRQQREMHPVCALQKVVSRWLCFVASTSGQIARQIRGRTCIARQRRRTPHKAKCPHADKSHADARRACNQPGLPHILHAQPPPGVEQSFTKILATVTPQVGNINDLLFSAYCKLAVDAKGMGTADVLDLCRGAQKVWVRWQG